MISKLLSGKLYNSVISVFTKFHSTRLLHMQYNLKHLLRDMPAGEIQSCTRAIFQYLIYLLNKKTETEKLGY